jgi:divalent metal cation (Fe/Co/Zn/Cd) transporter
MAAAKDNFSDAMVSIGAAAGIVGAQFGLPWIDSAAAVAGRPADLQDSLGYLP